MEGEQPEAAGGGGGEQQGEDNNNINGRAPESPNLNDGAAPAPPVVAEHRQQQPQPPPDPLDLGPVVEPGLPDDPLEESRAIAAGERPHLRQPPPDPLAEARAIGAAAAAPVQPHHIRPLPAQQRLRQMSGSGGGSAYIDLRRPAFLGGGMDQQHRRNNNNNNNDRLNNNNVPERNNAEEEERNLVAVAAAAAAAGGGGGGDASSSRAGDAGGEPGEIVASGWSDVERVGGSPPSARSLHAAALLNNVLYLWGGYDGTQRVNTFHAFSFAERRWSPVLPAAHSAPPPSPRDRHVAIGYSNSIYIHGGFNGTSRVADFYEFNIGTMCWREVVALQGRPPSPRHSHAAVIHGSSLFIFGGYDGSYKCDLHEFDFASSTWSLVPAAGRRPRARYRATCVVYKNLMILYGGHDGTRHLSDSHVFDFDTRTWSALHCEGTPPIPRDSHVSVVHGNCMFVFGGSSGSAMNDLHELQIQSIGDGNAGGGAGANNAVIGKWRPVHGTLGGGPTTLTINPHQQPPLQQQQQQPRPRPRFCHVAAVYNDSMYCFGGYDGQHRLSDFIKFDFAAYDLSFEVPPSTLLPDLRSLINDPTLSDITFVVEEQPVYAHKLLLVRCSYFQALFLGQMKESSLDTIHLEQVRYPIFLSVIEYLYTDNVTISLPDAMELFEAADLFCIPRLKTMCEKRMLLSITVESAAGVFHAADMHSAAALRQKAKKYILSHFEEASKSRSFEEMGRRNIDLVFELLQSR